MFAHFNWNAAPYFELLTSKNKLAKSLGLVFGRVSGLQGFEDAIANLQNATGFVCLAESSDGMANLDISPNAERVKTVFLGLRHAENDMEAREECLEALRELFRQFLSHLLRQKTSLHQQGIYLDQKIPFHEIDQYFASGCACTYFQIHYSTSVDLRFNKDEWEE